MWSPEIGDGISVGSMGGSMPRSAVVMWRFVCRCNGRFMEGLFVGGSR